MDTGERIVARIRAALSPETVTVEDHSAAHAGHAGSSGGGHFEVRIVADAFQGLRLLARHRLVYEAVADALSSGEIHALSITALTPEEAARA